MIRKFLLFAFLSFIVCSSTVFSMDLDFFEAYSIPENPTELIKKANAGDSKAQFTLAYLYAHGYSVKINPKQSFYWLKKSAAADHLPSLYRLAGYYLSGFGERKNVKKAIETLERGAILKPKSSFSVCLGDLYQDGIAIPRNYILSYKWYKIGSNGFGYPENQ